MNVQIGYEILAWIQQLQICGKYLTLCVNDFEQN
jgi:hypothetical protein